MKISYCRPAFLAASLLMVMSHAAMACMDRPLVWDIALGGNLAQFPKGFSAFSCGSNGGPPVRALTGIEAFAVCKPDKTGLYEVTFRNDDEPEFMARALQQSRGVALCEGTKVLGVPVIASALISDQGIIKGLRFVTDPRGIEPTARSQHWAMAVNLMQRFGREGWTCVEAPVAAGETPVGDFRQNETCTKRENGLTMQTVSAYYHRAGQAFLNEYGDVQPGFFVSESRFEMIRDE